MQIRDESQKPDRRFPSATPTSDTVYIDGGGGLILRSWLQVRAENLLAEHAPALTSPRKPIPRSGKLNAELNAVFFQRHVAHTDVLSGVNEWLLPDELL